MLRIFGLLLFAFSMLAFPVLAQEEDGTEASGFQERLPGEAMTVDRLEAILHLLNPETERNNNIIIFPFSIEDPGDLKITIITDPTADRMRIIVGVADESTITSEELRRVLQANFDSALDARYALGQRVLWATFIHPLGSLSDEDFLSGLGQTINLLVTFGTTYSSGLFIFGGGDSQGIIDDLLEKLRKKTEPEV